MKMNFGSWIVVSFVLFGAFIGTLVTICVRQDISLVSKDYYKEELAYQEQIDRQNNTERLGIKPEIRIVGKKLEVNFHQESGIQKAELKLFCPSDSKADKQFLLNNLIGGNESIVVEGFKPGMYKARLLWTMDGNEFYFEEVIYI